jgi:transposase
MPNQLSEQEIALRLIKLRNLEVAYPKLQEKYRSLETENQLLKARVVELETLTSLQAKQIETLQNTVEELKRIIFGRKSKPPTGGLPADSDNSSGSGSSGKQSRPASSYRRPVPADDEITDTQTFAFKGNTCPNCGGYLTGVKKVIRYVEDLLPLAEWKEALKRVTRTLVTTGYCRGCKKRVAAQSISPQLVSLGENLKGFVTFANVVLRLSYGQANDLLKTIANISISDGEQDNILYQQAGQLQPEYEQIKLRLNLEPANHYDETSWPTQKGKFGDYAWVKASSITEEAIFVLGQSRGKGNLNNLKGPPEQTGITDDYGAYRKAFKIHALCWAHPLRKFRDLTEAGYLTENQRASAVATYQSFAALYTKVRAVYSAKFNLVERLKILPELEAAFEKIFQPHENDPQKLLTLKESLKKNQLCYFVCLTTKDVSPDNNKAERTLRHLVLKRKNSYGSKTQKGADASSILYSVLLSLWRTSKDKFFTEYQGLLKQTKGRQTTALKLA